MRIVSRVEAGLAAPRRAMTPARASRNELFLHHSVTPLTSDPRRDWRAVQTAAFGRGFADISYTFGVHLDGTILEGRSPFVEGAHTEGHNRTAHAIVLVGNYHATQAAPRPVQPTDAQIDAVRWLRCHLTGIQLLTPDHTFRPHQAVKQTACPGSNALARWDDFARLAPPKEVRPMFDPPITVLGKVVATMPAPRGYWQLTDLGYVYAWEGAIHYGNTAGKPYFAGKVAARFDISRLPHETAADPNLERYVIVATSGERFGPVF